MACTVILELDVKPEAVDGVKEGLKGMLPDTRAYDGCISVFATTDQDNPNSVIAVEKWESRKHYETYFAWRGERGDLDALGEALNSPPVIRYLDTFDE